MIRCIADFFAGREERRRQRALNRMFNDLFRQHGCCQDCGSEKDLAVHGISLSCTPDAYPQAFCRLVCPTCKESRTRAIDHAFVNFVQMVQERTADEIQEMPPSVFYDSGECPPLAGALPS